MMLQSLFLPRQSRALELYSQFSQWFTRDPRHYQILFLGIFLCYGLSILKWDIEPAVFASAFGATLITQYLFIVFKTKDLHGLKSAMISSLSLCLMLRTNEPMVMMLAGILSISSKFIFRFNTSNPNQKSTARKHFFNPTNFGIITTIFLTQAAWISPGQWGNDGLLVFSIGILGLIVLLKVKRLDTAFAFFITFCLLQLVRSVFVLGWSFDVFLHHFTSGTLLLFTFFMITDPVSTPSHKHARIIWAILVALVAFYLSTYEFVNGAPLYALFLVSPLTLLFDKLFIHSKFSWI